MSEEKTTLALRKDFEIGKDRIDLIKRTICNGATDDELELYLAVVRNIKLDPFLNQIVPIFPHDEGQSRRGMRIQIGIDGLRVLSERSGKYRGQIGPFWCGPDGVWVDVWLKQQPPSAAKVGVLRSDHENPIWGVATFKSFCRSKNPRSSWSTHTDIMLAKCAEAQARRIAFPNDTSLLYIKEEIESIEDELDKQKSEGKSELKNINVANTAAEASKKISILARKRRLWEKREIMSMGELEFRAMCDKLGIVEKQQCTHEQLDNLERSMDNWLDLQMTEDQKITPKPIREPGADEEEEFV